MKAKTLEAIKRHGESLLQAFPDATERDPVALCKKLRRVETAISRVTERACSVYVPDEEMKAAEEKALARVRKLLGLTPTQAATVGLFVNHDPRGYALKFSDEWTTSYNAGQNHKDGKPLHRDWGGYGIAAPDLTTN